MSGRADAVPSQPEPEPRKRGAVPLALSKYSALHFALYVLYPPLFIAGPILGFNDWVRQLDNPPQLTRASKVSYALRFASCMLAMEFVLHFCYVNAIKDSKAWRGYSPVELSMVGFWNLIVIWLKVSCVGAGLPRGAAADAKPRIYPAAVVAVEVL